THDATPLDPGVAKSQPATEDGLRAGGPTLGSPALRTTRCGASILRRRFAHDGLEVADEVRLVEVAKVLSKGGDVQFMAFGQPVGGLMEPVPLNNPFRGHSDVVAEEPLQGSLTNTDPIHHVVDVRYRTVADDEPDDPVDVAHGRVGWRQPGAEE